MRTLIGGLLGILTMIWFFWAATLSGLTVFMYLGGGPNGWDAHLAYALSAIGLVPVLGGLVASFMADTVHGWGFFHAAFNLLGYLVTAALVGVIGQSKGTSAP